MDGHKKNITERDTDDELMRNIIVLTLQNSDFIQFYFKILVEEYTY